jgi:hypothetical protein
MIVFWPRPCHWNGNVSSMPMISSPLNSGPESNISTDLVDCRSIRLLTLMERRTVHAGSQKSDEAGHVLWLHSDILGGVD